MKQSQSMAELEKPFALDSVLGDLDKNASAMALQNLEIQQLQDRVSQFLLADEAKGETNLPPIS